MQVCAKIAACVGNALCFIHKVRTSQLRTEAYLFMAMLLAIPGHFLSAAWGDASAGLPPIQVVPASVLGADTDKSLVVQDKLGRLFIGSNSLLVFDGQSWTAHAKPGEHPLTFLTLGPNGVLWAGSKNDFGYFEEQPLGVFKFRSLASLLPDRGRDLDFVWACAPFGSLTYFICKDRLIRWDGQTLEVTRFETDKRRLSPLKLGDEYWFQHFETGLYRLTESGPELKFAANALPEPLIIALLRDEKGLVTVSNRGLHRPGNAVPLSPPELNEYLAQSRVSSFAELPDGNLIIGTLSGGLVLTSRKGDIIRKWADSSSGLPGRTVLSLAKESGGEIMGTTPADFFHFTAAGHSTVFNAANGLKGQAISAFALWRSALYAATDDGAYQQVENPAGGAASRRIPELDGRYNHILACRDGLLLARFAGVDWFDGTTVRPVYDIPANFAFEIVPAKSDENSFYVLEVNRIARLTRKAGGGFDRDPFLELSDTAVSLHEAASGRLWIGTYKGAFLYDAGTKSLSPINNPDDAQPFPGIVRIIADGNRILLFANGQTFQADATGRQFHRLAGLPFLNPSVVQLVPHGNQVLVAFERRDVTSGPLHGVGVITFAADGTATWRNLDLPPLDTIGSIRTMLVAEEKQGTVLWLGGMNGVLRVDYDSIPTLPPPPAPIIKLRGELPRDADRDGTSAYPFKGHHLGFQVFTGNYSASRHWNFQTRLGDGTGSWSPPAAGRSFEYTNLSEGLYQFEVRAVNTAGESGPTATIAFRILPPWYRSRWAYGGYSVALLLGVFAFIRVRERRIRERNQELETLVGVRTAELVKANAAKDEFLAGISHEIRNPMNGVIGIAENFKTEGLDLENRRKFNLLRQCASHLSSLLEDILDFSKVQAGAIELDPKPFDLPELVESVAGITRADSEKYGIPVEVAVSPGVPRQLVGDARRIRQILINFVSNALKFSGRGEVCVTVWCKPAAEGQTEVVFAVSDEGPGISAEEQARLFTRFERGAAAQKGRVPGTGLGLALCKGLAEKMGGRIWLESEPGRGSCFHFSAPFPVVTEAAAVAPAVTGPAIAGARSALIVDDQEYNRIVLAEHLQSLGFKVHSAQEGQAALDAAARQAFDVIFLDFNLPGLSGVDVARNLRSSNGPSAHALILATTAFTTPEKRAQCLDAGMDAFLGKPVTREKVAKAVAGLPPAAATPVAAPAAAPSTKLDGPADRLGNLRLLARKKGVPVADELALYFSEMDAELAQLDAAIEAQDATEAGRYSHMLCGRCSFIFERDLEQTQRQVEAAIHAAQWLEVRQHRAAFGAQLAATRVRLAASDSAIVPPGSGR